MAIGHRPRQARDNRLAGARHTLCKTLLKRLDQEPIQRFLVRLEKLDLSTGRVCEGVRQSNTM